MECKHIDSYVKINREQIAHSKSNSQEFSNCKECSDKVDSWICLYCGEVYCSRYVSKHFMEHSTKAKHLVGMSLNNLAVFCFCCDDYVINDEQLNEIRKELKTNDTDSDESSVNLEEIVSTKSSTQGNQETSSGCDSGLEESLSSGKTLRPRKRTKSDDDDGDGKVGKKPTISLKKAKGIKNIGNTCFMNSVLQSLHNIQQFSIFFSSLPKMEMSKPRPYYSRSIKENLDEVFLVEELRKVFMDLNSTDNNKTAISPECLFMVIWKVTPQFRGYHQHDAHEFLRYMLDRLNTELQNIYPTSSALPLNTNSKLKNYICPSPNKTKSGSVVTKVFGGTLLSAVVCLVCGTESKKHDPFLDLSLDIPEKYYKTNATDDATKKQQSCHLSDCLSSFTEIEELTETELYYCSACKCKQKSTKRFWIRLLPNVLCLHIKRFRWNSSYRTKIDLSIAFPITALDLSKFVLNGPETRRSNNTGALYDLAAVIVHHGTGTSNGHYTSYANNGGTWMHFNDSTVKEVTVDQVSQCKPYILFYIKRGVASPITIADSIVGTDKGNISAKKDQV